MIAGAALAALHLIPRPQLVHEQTDCGALLRRHLRVPAQFDAGAMELLNERWRALGIPAVVRVGANQAADIVVRRAPHGAPQSYGLTTTPDGRVGIAAADGDGAFYAAATLAQLPVKTSAGWTMPCVSIGDAPAMKWRIASDDVSRGPLPTMRYFKERIRTVASFKMNGYSPYMEHVYRAPDDPLPAPLDGITPAQLHELDVYARRFHVTFIPQQQSFAHMHNTLRYERYAPAAETPHAFLLSPASAISLPYVARVIRSELAQVPHTPFFHIGSDETSALGKGQSKPLAEKMGLSALYARHINELNAIVRPSGARIMFWDDGIENDPKIMQLVPRDAVVVNWHYGNEKTFMPYIDLLKRGGFEQMVDPGTSNWNQIYPNINTALTVEDRFIGEGKSAHVLGLYMSTWHDDGESLFEATWYPMIYAAAASWEKTSVPFDRFRADFPHAFFGSDDARYGSDMQHLADIATAMTDMYGYSGDWLMWADPFDPLFAAHMGKVDVRNVRLQAEDVEQHLLLNRPPLHANAAAVMFLAARKYDFIGSKYQMAQEIRTRYYTPANLNLTWTKYWFWDMRDGYTELEPLYAAAWRYEDRESHLDSNLERYHAAAQQAIARADRVQSVVLHGSDAAQPLPPLEDILGH